MRALAVVLLLGTVFACADTVCAQSAKGLVLSFRGRAAGAARSLVVSAISDELTLARRSDAHRTARKLGVSLGTAAGIRRVAEHEGIDLVIRGRVRGRGRRTRVVIIVHNADGDVLVRRAAGPPYGRRGRRRVRRAARATVGKALRRLESAADAAGREAEDTGGAGEGGSGAKDAAGAASGQSGDAGGATGAEAAEAAGGTDTPAGSAPPWLTALAGPGFRVRRAVIETVDGDRIYDSNPFFELAFRVELRPWASDDSAWSGLHALATAGFSIGLSSTDQETGKDVDTKSHHFLIAVGYILDFLEDRLHAAATVGFLYDAFLLDDNGVMPSVTYPAVRLGARVKVDIVEWLYGQFELGGRFPFSTGDLTDEFGEMNDEFGEAASARGFDWALALGGELRSGFGYMIRAGGRRYGLDIEGMGQPEADVGTDKAFFGMALIGWSFR